MPLWLLFALLTALFWSIGETFAKKGFDFISPLWSNIFAGITGLFIWIPIALIGTGFHLQVPSVGVLFIIFLTGVCYMSYYYAISKGKLALTGTLFEIYPIFTIILSFIFLHERLLSYQAFGIIMTLLGILFIVWPSKKEIGKIHDYTWVLWGLFGAFLEGTGDFFAKITDTSIGGYSQMFFLVLLFQIVLVLNYFLDKKGRKLPKFSIKEFWPSIIGTAGVTTGTACLIFALQYGEASKVTPVTAAAPAVVVILAVLFLKERINKRQVVGILGVILGVLLVSL